MLYIAIRTIVSHLKTIIALRSSFLIFLPEEMEVENTVIDYPFLPSNISDNAACGVCCVWGMLRVGYAVYGVCCVWGMLRVGYAVYGVCCVWDMLRVGYAACGVCCVWGICVTADSIMSSYF